MAMLALILFPATADASKGYLTSSDPLIELEGSRGKVIPIIDSGDVLGDFTFQGLPDGTGLAPGPRRNTVDIYVAHEETHVPFFGEADFQDSSVSKLTLSTKKNNRGSVLKASVALSPDEGYIRFCSAFMASPADGFAHYTFFTGEESNDVIPVVDGAAYGADPALAPDRQAGYVVAHDTVTGENIPIPGMGRLNHENTVPVNGHWPGVAMLTTDDTFSAGTSQLYLYSASSGNAVLADEGALYAFQVTATETGPVDPYYAFNGANDYLDITPGESWQGRFIEVPRDVATGTTDVAPQDALEEWSNANNVFQFVRLEDIATDKNNPTIAYVADTGSTRIVPDPETGRMVRGPSGTVGFADGGRIFKFEFNPYNPLEVTGFSILAQGDDATADDYVPFVNPDNLDTSTKSLMVQEDHDDARIWQHKLSSGKWRVVAHVTDPDGESSGITDASAWFGAGWWFATVQAHGSNQLEEMVGDVLLKREDGQLLLIKIPGS
jgi:hypothetical protein